MIGKFGRLLLQSPKNHARVPAMRLLPGSWRVYCGAPLPSKPCVWLLQPAPTALKRRVGWLNWRGGIKSVRELSVDGKPSRLI